MPQPIAALTECYRGGSDGRPGWWLRFDDASGAVARQLDAYLPAADRLTRRHNHAPQWWVAAGHEDLLSRLFPTFAAYREQAMLPGLG